MLAQSYVAPITTNLFPPQDKLWVNMLLLQATNIKGAVTLEGDFLTVSPLRIK